VNASAIKFLAEARASLPRMQLIVEASRLWSGGPAAVPRVRQARKAHCPANHPCRLLGSLTLTAMSAILTNLLPHRLLSWGIFLRLGRSGDPAIQPTAPGLHGLFNTFRLLCSRDFGPAGTAPLPRVAKALLPIAWITRACPSLIGRAPRARCAAAEGCSGASGIGSLAGRPSARSA